MTSLKTSRHFPATQTLRCALAIALAASSAGCAFKTRQGSGSSFPAFDASIAAMPNPAANPLRADGKCVDQPVRFVSAVDKSQAGWLLPGYDVRFRHWALKHYGQRAGFKEAHLCFDGDFAVRAWQRALGHTETGIMTRAEAKTLVDIVDTHEKGFITAKRNEIVLDPRPGDAEMLARAIKAYEASKDDVALPLFENLANRGNPRAQVYLGRLYVFGNGIEHDKRDAMRWFARSAQSGDPEGMAALAISYLEGWVKKDYSRAMKTAEQAAATGHPEGYIALAHVIATTEGPGNDYTTDMKRITRAIQLARDGNTDPKVGESARALIARLSYLAAQLQPSEKGKYYRDACNEYSAAFSDKKKLALADGSSFSLYDLDKAYVACKWLSNNSPRNQRGQWSTQFESIDRLARATEPRMKELNLRMKFANYGAPETPLPIQAEPQSKQVSDWIAEGIRGNIEFMERQRAAELEQERRDIERDQMERQQEYSRRLMQEQLESERRWRASQGLGY